MTRFLARLGDHGGVHGVGRAILEHAVARAAHGGIARLAGALRVDAHHLPGVHQVDLAHPDVERQLVDAGPVPHHAAESVRHAAGVLQAVLGLEDDEVLAVGGPRGLVARLHVGVEWPIIASCSYRLTVI